MKALLSTAPGGPDTLTFGELPDPAPGPGEVLIRVRACGVNFPDALMIEDRYQATLPRPFAPGSEVAGVIEALGPEVTGLALGDRVMTGRFGGGLAELTLARAAQCALMPKAMSFEEGAAFLVNYATALYGLRGRGGLRAGESVLVLGAAGGVGLATVQVAKALGARVVAAASSEEKAALAKSQGADETIVYGKGPFEGADAKTLANQFKAAAGKTGYDIVVDIVGGDYAEAALRAIGWEGRFLVVGFPAGIPKLPLNLVLLKSCQVIGVFYGAFGKHDPVSASALLKDVVALYEKGSVRPHISEIFPFSRGAEALRALIERRATGKLVVTVP